MNKNKFPLAAIVLAAGAVDPALFYQSRRPEPMRARKPGPDDIERINKAQQKRERRQQRNLRNKSLLKK